MENNRYQWWALTGLSILAFIAFLDVTIVNTALPAIQQHFHANVIRLQWITNIFYLTNCMFMVLSGKLGDIYGHRRVFYNAIFIFGLSAFGAGLSPTIDWVIFFRAIQGSSSAAIFSIAVALISETISKEYHTKAIGIYSAITGFGLAIGPFLGGLIVTLLNWRWVFFVNIPLIITGLVFTSFSLKKSPGSSGEIKIDWLGFFLLIIGIGSLVYGLIRGEQLGWHQPMIWLLLFIAVIAFTSLIFVEKRISQPLLDLTIFKNRYLMLAIISVVMGGVVSSVFMLFDPLFLNTILHQAPFIIGLMLVAIPIMQIILSSSITVITKYISIETVIVLAQIAVLIAAVMHFFMMANSPIFYIIIAFLFLGITWGAANTGSVTVVNKHADPKHIGSIIGTVFTAWNLSGSIALAISVVIFHAQEKALMKKHLLKYGITLSQKQKDYIASVLSDPEHALSTLKNFTGDKYKEIYEAFHHSFLSGFHSVMLFMIIVSLFAFTLAFYLNRKQKI